MSRRRWRWGYIVYRGFFTDLFTPDGIEIDFYGLSPDELQLLRKICDEVDFDISAL